MRPARQPASCRPKGTTVCHPCRPALTASLRLPSFSSGPRPTPHITGLYRVYQSATPGSRAKGRARSPLGIALSGSLPPLDRFGLRGHEVARRRRAWFMSPCPSLDLPKNVPGSGREIVLNGNPRFGTPARPTETECPQRPHIQFHDQTPESRTGSASGAAILLGRSLRHSRPLPPMNPVTCHSGAGECAV